MELLFPVKDVDVALLVALRTLLDDDESPYLVFGTNAEPNLIHPSIYSLVGVSLQLHFWYREQKV
jgi:hypothetical protein